MNLRPDAEQPLLSPNDVVLSIGMILKNWVFILICAVLSVGLGVAYLATTVPTLEFSARLLVAPHDRLLDQDRDFPDDKQFLPTQAEVIGSPAVIREAARDLAGGEEPDELLVQDLMGRLSVRPLLGTNVLSLRLQDRDTENGLATLKAVINSYRKYVTDIEQTSHRETITLLFDREKELRDEIARLQGEYGKLHHDGPLVGQDTISAEPRARLEAIKEELVASRTRRIKIAGFLQQFESLVGAAEADVTAVSVSGSDRSVDASLSKPVLAASLELVSRMDQAGLIRLQDPLIQQALMDARAREASLSGQFGDRHPDVKGVRKQISSLEKQVEETIRMAPSILQNELASMSGQETELSQAYAEEFKHCKQLDAAMVGEQRVLDEIKSVQTIHDRVMTQINHFELADNAIASGQSSITVRELNSPQVLAGGTWPQPIPVLSACAALGLAAGFLLVVASQWFGLQRKRGLSGAAAPAPPAALDASALQGN